jgi:hypothetical protein
MEKRTRIFHKKAHLAMAMTKIFAWKASMSAVLMAQHFIAPIRQAMTTKSATI